MCIFSCIDDGNFVEKSDDDVCSLLCWKPDWIEFRNHWKNNLFLNFCGHGFKLLANLETQRMEIILVVQTSNVFIWIKMHWILNNSRRNKCLFVYLYVDSVINISKVNTNIPTSVSWLGDKRGEWECGWTSCMSLESPTFTFHNDFVNTLALKSQKCLNSALSLLKSE